MTTYRPVLCVVRHLSPRAIRIETGVGEFHWIPRAVLKQPGKNYRVDDTPTIEINERFLRDKGLRL